MPVVHSLENLDADMDATIQLTSPRSIEACEASGIFLDELVKRDLSYFKEQANLSRGIESSERFIKQKAEHYEQKRKKKVGMVKSKRDELIATRKALEAEKKDELSGVLEQERRQNQKMRDRQRKELQNLLAYELRRQQIEEENNKNMLRAREKEEAMRREQIAKQKAWEEHQRKTLEEKWQAQIEEEERAHRRAAEITAENQRKELEAEEKERKARIELQERNQRRMEKRKKKRLAVEAKNAEIQRQLVLKRQEMELQEIQRVKKIEEQRAAAAALAKEEQERKRQQFLAIQSANARLLEEKKEASMAKEVLAEQRMQLFEQEREAQKNENAKRAQGKAEHLREVKAKSDYLLELEVQKALHKERAVNARLAERARNQEHQAILQRDVDMRKAQDRQALKTRGEMMERERVEQMLRRREIDDQRREAAERERQDRILYKQAEDKLLAEDRKEHAIRRARIKEYESRQLLMRIEQDDERVEEMKQQQLIIQEQRRRMRDLSTQQRLQIMEKFDDIKNSVNLEDISKGGADGDQGPGGCEIDLRQYGLDVDMKLTINLSALASKDGVPRLGKKKSKKKKEFAATTMQPFKNSGDFSTRSAPEAVAKPKSKPKPKRTTPKRTKPKKPKAEATLLAPTTAMVAKPSSVPMGGAASTTVADSDDSDADQQLDRSRSGGRTRTKKPTRRMKNSSSSKALAPVRKRQMASSRSTSQLSRTYGNPSQFIKKNRRRQPKPLRRVPTISRVDAERIVESVAAEQNQYLLKLLERERENEATREKIYENAKDSEKQKLDDIFGQERAKAGHIIKTISHEHENVLQTKMLELGLAL